MYIKLLFTADKGLEPLLRILAYIINTSSITSAATLNTALTNASIFAADIGNGFDSTNSQIIRTVDLGPNTKAHIAKPALANTIYFTLQQPVYDSPSTYYYSQFFMNTANAATSSYVSDGLTGGTMASSQLAQTQAATAAIAGGTALNPINSSNDYNAGFNTPAVSNWRALHCYITDKTFWWGLSVVGGATGVGWSGIYNSSSTISGCFTSQYTRQDHWNTATNGIIPVAATRMTTSYNGLFSNSSHTANTTTLTDGSTSALHVNIQPLKVLNMINLPCVSQTGTYSKDYHRIVSHDLGGMRNSSSYNLFQTLSTNTTGVEGYRSYGCMFVNAAGYKNANATNTAAVFSLYPLTWSNMQYGAYGGGNISEQSNVYIFYGDYSPGDEFSYNSKTYTLWPNMQGPTNLRLGFAIPKE
jgi:hypothetical protein